MHSITNGFKHFLTTNSTDPRQRVPLTLTAMWRKHHVWHFDWPDLFRWLALTMLCVKFDWITYKYTWRVCDFHARFLSPLSFAHGLHPLTGNACILNPCNTNGQCTPTTSGAGYTCSCFIGWDGTNCDEGKFTTTNFCFFLKV